VIYLHVAGKLECLAEVARRAGWLVPGLDLLGKNGLVPAVSLSSWTLGVSIARAPIRDQKGKMVNIEHDQSKLSTGPIFGCLKFS